MLISLIVFLLQEALESSKASFRCEKDLRLCSHHFVFDISLQCDQQHAVSSCWENSFNTTLMLLTMRKNVVILLIWHINIRSKREISPVSTGSECLSQRVQKYFKNLLDSFYTCAQTWIWHPPVSHTHHRIWHYCVMYNNISEIEYIRLIYSVHEEESVQHHIFSFSVILMIQPQCEPPLFNLSCPHFISHVSLKIKKKMMKCFLQHEIILILSTFIFPCLQ